MCGFLKMEDSVTIGFNTKLWSHSSIFPLVRGHCGMFQRDHFCTPLGAEMVGPSNEKGCFQGQNHDLTIKHGRLTTKNGGLI